MADLTVMDCTHQHVHMIVEKMGREERFKGIPYKQIVWRSFRNSMIKRAAFIGDEIAVIGGCYGSALSGQGELWLCSTREVEKMPLAFVKQARKELIKVLAIFPKVYGKVSPIYQNAPGFLQLMGFTLSEPTMGPKGMVYHRFSMELR